MHINEKKDILDKFENPKMIFNDSDKNGEFYKCIYIDTFDTV